jgi:hypothetical protein
MRQPIQRLAGAALGRFGVTGAASGGGQVFPRFGKASFEVTDLRLEPVRQSLPVSCA